MSCEFAVPSKRDIRDMVFVLGTVILKGYKKGRAWRLVDLRNREGSAVSTTRMIDPYIERDQG